MPIEKQSLSQPQPPTPAPDWQVKPGPVQFWKTIRSHIEQFAYSYSHELSMLEFPQLHSSVCGPETDKPSASECFPRVHRGTRLKNVQSGRREKFSFKIKRLPLPQIPHLLTTQLLNLRTGALVRSQAETLKSYRSLWEWCEYMPP